MDDKQVQKDIESMVNYLKIFQPDKATPEYAAAILDFVQTNLHDLAIHEPEEMLNLFEADQESQDKK